MDIVAPPPQLTWQYGLHQVSLLDLRRRAQQLQHVVGRLVMTKQKDLLVHPVETALWKLKRRREVISFSSSHLQQSASASAALRPSQVITFLMLLDVFGCFVSQQLWVCLCSLTLHLQLLFYLNLMQRKCFLYHNIFTVSLVFIILLFILFCSLYFSNSPTGMNKVSSYLKGKAASRFCLVV